jgi:hypothetical protein
MNKNSQWGFMLKRQLPPVIQSIYGVYLSRVYDKFLAIYKDGISYWFTNKKFLDTYDKKYIEKMKETKIDRECDNTIKLYEQALNNVIDVLGEYKKKKKISDIKLLELLCDSKFLKHYSTKYNFLKYVANKSTIELKNEIANVKTLFDNYGVIASYPPMTAGASTQEELLEKIAHIEYNRPFNELGDRDKFKIENHVGTLIWHEKLFQSPYHNYEKDLLRIVLAIKNKLALSEATNNATKNIRDNIIDDTDFLIEVGLHFQLKKRISEYLIDKIRRNPLVIKFLEDFNWIGGVWKFGGKLDSDAKNKIVGEILQYIVGNKKMPEISLAELEEAEIIYPSRRKKLIEELVYEEKEFNVYFEKECLPYTEIIRTNQTIRFYRKCYLPIINEKIGNLMKDVAKRLGLNNWEDIHYLTVIEILEGLKRRSIIKQRELEKRKKAFLTIFENGKITKISGKEAVESKVNQFIDEKRLDRKPWPDYEVKWDKKILSKA